MRVRCPHCHNPLEVVDDSSFKNLTCESCGSSFSLVGGNDTTGTERYGAGQIGHFQLLGRVGLGAFGSVWKAKDLELDRIVAVKVPRTERLDAADAEKFLREARAAAQLRHDNIVSVHEVGKENDNLYIVSDYVDGADLKGWLSQRRLATGEASDLCATIAEAIHHAHEKGVIHRDLKPSNVMMDRDGKPHVMDFGLARRESGEITMTVEGAVLGTPAYMSPEQAEGKGHDADRRADVYSLGVILFEMLTGELPFRGDKRMLRVQILAEAPPSPRKLNSMVPRDLETICLKCLSKEPSRRYQSADELSADLRRFLANQPILARPASTWEKFWKWSGSNIGPLTGFYAIADTFSVAVQIAASVAYQVTGFDAGVAAGSVTWSVLLVLPAILIPVSLGIAAIRGNHKVAPLALAWYSAVVMFAFIPATQAGGAQLAGDEFEVVERLVSIAEAFLGLLLFGRFYLIEGEPSSRGGVANKLMIMTLAVFPGGLVVAVGGLLYVALFGMLALAMGLPMEQ